MPVVILRLLTLVALVLMPFGMSAASAVPVHHAPAPATTQHCDEQGGQPVQQSPDGAMDCAMACSMLVSAPARVDDPVQAVRLPNARLLIESVAGLHPDTATPPPKLS